MNKYKACTKCGQIKPHQDFSINRARSSGLQSQCKECERIYRAKYYVLNKDKEIARVDKWHKSTEKGKANRQKQRQAYREKHPSLNPRNKDLSGNAVSRRKAKRHKKNLIRRAYMRNAEKCFISDKEIQRLRMKPCIYCGSTTKMTIDHVIPLARGGRHSIGNLVPACHKCNSHKHARFIMEWRLNKSRK